MKKLLLSLASAPILLAGCGITVGPAVQKPKDGEIVVAKEYDYTDNVSDAWTKDYYKEDMDVINKLWSSTVAVAALSESINVNSGQTLHGVCNSIASGNSSAGDITAPDTKRRLNYADKTADDSWNNKGVPQDYTIKKGGENLYLNTGTGWVIAQNTTHYFIATNHHVAVNFSRNSGDLPGIANGPGTIDECITIAATDSPNKVAAVVDRSIGNNGLVYNGRGASGSDHNWTDIAIVALKKADFNIAMPTVKVSKTVVEATDMSLTRSRVLDMLNKEKLYTAGFPSGAKRPNMTETPKALKSNITPYTIASNEQYDTTWNNPYFEYNYFTDGGSSGSAVVNSKGELEFLNTLKIGDPSQMVNDDYWTQFRSAGIPAFWINKILETQVCANNNPYDMDICK